MPRPLQARNSPIDRGARDKTRPDVPISTTPEGKLSLSVHSILSRYQPKHSALDFIGVERSGTPVLVVLSVVKPSMFACKLSTNVPS